MQTNIIQLLENTLNPSLISQAEYTLLTSRTQQGFITNLLIIGVNNELSIPIRQSALIYLKNALADDNKNIIRIPDNDFQTVKSSILSALIRNCDAKLLTPTLRQIIYVVADSCYPDQWVNIIPEIINNLQNGSNFEELYGSIEGLKAIVSAIGMKVDHKLTIQNLSNKIVLPLLSLASKLFQNYNQTTSFILISIFKIFSTLTNFFIPQNILLNMHSWMIFIKKLLDLNIESGNIDQNMYQLKKMCLRILFRFYQRHMNIKYSDIPKNTINEFHNKFTKGIVQSLLFQIINEAQISKTSTNKNYIQLTKYSLACLSYVYEENRNAAIMIDNCKDKIIYLCLERYKGGFSKGHSSYVQFSQKLNEQRVHLCKFIRALIDNQTKYSQQISKGNQNYSNQNEINAILGCLYTHFQKGDMGMKQLCLYIYSDIASVMPGDDADIQSKMLAFILTNINPLLNSIETPTVIKLRCCQFLTKYNFIQIPENELKNIAGGVYGCLIQNQNRPQSGSIQTFLQIHAVHAFNSLLRYDVIVNITAEFLKNILIVYTSLLEIQVSIIKCLEDMLAKYDKYLQPYGNNLIETLSEMYFKYNQLVIQSRSGQIKQTKKNGLFHKNITEKEDQDQDDQQFQQSADNNFLNASKACLGAIRQIIQAQNFTFEKDQLVHDLLISIFSDKEQLHTEEGFNILNQVIFKKKTLNSEYNLYFSVIIFGILPLNQNYIDKLKSDNSNYANALLRMFQVLCSNPDQDFIQNTIGCLRNFISKSQQGLRDQIDNSGVSFLQLIMKAVKFVHQNQSSKATQTDRSIILTLYISLIEWNAVNDLQVKQILNNVGSWLKMEKQACLNNLGNSNSKKSHQKNTSDRQDEKRTIYGPIYLQIILLSCHFYPKVTLQIMNGNWIANQLLQNWDRFHCDYELTRIIIGISDLLNYQSITDKSTSCQIINRLPQFIQKQCRIRVGQDGNDVKSQDDEAEEQKMFGLDQNTHIMGWKNNNPPKPNQPQNQMQQQDSEDQDDEEQEFNKYYESPLDNIDEIAYAFNILKDSNCQAYMNFMRTDVQQKLSFLISNAPSKFSQNNN